MVTESDAKALSVTRCISETMSGPFCRSLARKILSGMEGDLARSIPDSIKSLDGALNKTLYERVDFDNDRPLSSYHSILDSVSARSFSEALDSSITNESELGEEAVSELMGDFADIMASLTEDAVLEALSPKSLTKIMGEAVWDSHIAIAEVLKRHKVQSDKEVEFLSKELLGNGWVRLRGVSNDPATE